MPLTLTREPVWPAKPTPLSVSGMEPTPACSWSVPPAATVTPVLPARAEAAWRFSTPALTATVPVSVLAVENVAVPLSFLISEPKEEAVVASVVVPAPASVSA